MADITAIILTLNEEKNIEECIRSAKQIASRIIVVDSGSTDSTVQLAQKFGAETVYHQWETHSRQFNWALDNCNISTTWVFRLDADERITIKLAEEINYILSSENVNKYSGFQMRWQIVFMGRILKHGGIHKPYFLRLFRFGQGRATDTIMDEHIVVDGETAKLQNDLLHYDYKGLDEWLKKHISYSNLEINQYYKNIDSCQTNNKQLKRRSFYYSLPLFIRAKLYYWFRYYWQLGFLDGREGKIFIYLQAYWYRFLVDAKILEQSRNQGNQNE